MAKDSAISWTHHTFNSWRGCTKVSTGCKYCYADVLSKRNPTSLGIWGPKGSRPIAAEAYWRQPLRWDAEAKAAGERRRVFCASLADVFEGPETMPEADRAPVLAARERLLVLIEETPNLDWLLLTKRPENVMSGAGFILNSWRDGFPDNVWVGTSVEDQAAADARIPYLLKVPAKVRFLSCEPLLGPVDLNRIVLEQGEDPDGAEDDVIHCFESCSGEMGVHWVIAGGESGPNARPMNPNWARSLRDQCARNGVPFHFKQVGAWEAYEHYDQHEWESAYSRKLIDGNVFPDFDDPRTKGWDRDIEEGLVFRNLGAGATGSLLDGVLHDAFPEVALAR